MVTAMKYISITGHISNMNHVVHRYLTRFDIQLEQSAVSGLTEPFTTLNPYAITLQKAEFFSNIVGKPPALHLPMTASDAVNLVEESARAYDQRDDSLRNLENKLAEVTAYIRTLQDFANFDTDLSELEYLSYINCKFGRMTTTSFRQYEKFLTDDQRIIFSTIKRDQSHIWGAYFSPMIDKDEVDAVFASLGFDCIDVALSMNPSGTPAQISEYWQGESRVMQEEICALTQAVLSGVMGSRERLAIACEKVKTLYAAFDVKKYAALSKSRRIFTFSGWMPSAEARTLEEEIAHDDLAVFTRYAFEREQDAAPPTILKNPPIIRQFEFFTRLYGLPQYGEIDPTPFLAVTYTLLFGLMFGDVGHGFVLAMLGLVVRHKWQNPLGGIMAVVGASAMFFGFLYGSIFGFEDVLPALWLRPAANISQTLIFAAGLGVGLIALSMLIYMYNAFRQGRISDLLFGANGVAGFTFYAAALWLAVRVFVLGRPVTGVVATVAVLPLLFVAFKHPIERLMAGSGILPREGVGQFVFNMIVELFEVLLTYATNTISFVRVGAFAVSHAGMMHVVLQLSQGAAGIGHWLIIIMGNVLVMGIEGLLVGIQVLRLDFYEIFSRFYTGGGRVFTSSKFN